jgi:restriction endonuclease
VKELSKRIVDRIITEEYAVDGFDAWWDELDYGARLDLIRDMEGAVREVIADAIREAVGPWLKGVLQ